MRMTRELSLSTSGRWTSPAAAMLVAPRRSTLIVRMTSVFIQQPRATVESGDSLDRSDPCKVSKYLRDVICLSKTQVRITGWGASPKQPRHSEYGVLVTVTFFLTMIRAIFHDWELIALAH